MDNETLKQEQSNVVDHNDGNLLLSASAGSGKTFVMIKRIIRLVAKKKVGVKEIMAVTYTEASANDIKEKLRKALVEEYNVTGDRFLVEQLNDLPTADISTMHSFCRRLIKKYFFKAEISPDFKLIDESESSSMKRTALNQLFKECYDNPSEQFKELCDKHFKGRNDRELREVIIKIFRLVETEARPKDYLYKSLDLYSEKGLRSIVDYYADKKYREFRKKREIFKARPIKVDGEKYPKFYKSILSLGEYFDEVLESFESGEILNYDKKVDNFSTEKLDKNSLEEKEKEEYKKIKSYVSATVRSVKSLRTDTQRELDFLEGYKRHAQSLADMVARFMDIYQDMKAEEDVVDFADLEHFALKVLSDNEAAEEIKRQYKYIFVDECQDINGVQDQIIERLASNNLFMVGDVKQSIYGFRGCKPEIFQAKFNDMDANGGFALRLNYNFRCAPYVIKFVNKVFNYSMKEDNFGEDYSRSELVAGGVYGEDKDGETDKTGRVKFHHIVKENSEDSSEDDGEGKRPLDNLDTVTTGEVQEEKTQKEPLSVYDIEKIINGQVEDEYDAISSRIYEIIEEERKLKYYDFKTKKFENIKYGDIAILAKNRDNPYVKGIVRGLLKRGIPVTSLVGNNVCDYPEIQIFTNLFALILCFQNDIPLATVMKSAIGKFTDDDLMGIVRIASDGLGYVDNFYEAYGFVKENDCGPLSERILVFDKYISELRFLADFKSARQILKKVISDFKLDAHLLASKDGEKKLRRLNAYLSATVTPDREYTVREFYNKLNDGSFEIPLSESAGEDDCVRVMTIHHSKGLEYPVVIVCGMEQSLAGKRDTSPIRTERGVGFVVKKYDPIKRLCKDSMLSKYTYDRVMDNLITERLRLLYVALTRAKYSLHVVFQDKEDYQYNDLTSIKRFIDFFPKELIDGPREEVGYFREVQKSAGCVDEIKNVSNLPKNQTVESYMKKRFDYVYPFEEDTSLPLKTSVTASVSQTQKVFDLEEVFEDKNQPLLNENTDARKGTIAHAILENFDFASGKPLAEQVEQMKLSGIILEEDLDGVNLKYLERATETLRNLVGKGKIYREREFLVQIPANEVLDKTTQTQVVMQGIVDLLVEDDDGYRVIDYKYSKKSAERLVETYSKQLDLYAYSVEKILGKPVKSKTLVNLVSGEVIDL